MTHSQARARQVQTLLIWFGTICALLLGIFMAFDAQAAAARGERPSRGATAEKAPLACMLSSNFEAGMLTIAITNSSGQIIDKGRVVHYQMFAGRNRPLHSIRAPMLVPVGEQLLDLVPYESDRRAGACIAWVYTPRAPLGVLQ